MVLTVTHEGVDGCRKEAAEDLSPEVRRSYRVMVRSVDVVLNDRLELLRDLRMVFRTRSNKRRESC